MERRVPQPRPDGAETNIFDLTIPFDNSVEVQNLPINLFKFSDTAIKIKEIKVDAPFSLVSINPVPPWPWKATRRSISSSR